MPHGKLARVGSSRLRNLGKSGAAKNLAGSASTLGGKAVSKIARRIGGKPSRIATIGGSGSVINQPLRRAGRRTRRRRG